jgi:2-succinyl-5-enolpyruvyl-6-hydroxy-3-cyclohexene-1-carboxylate synthase
MQDAINHIAATCAAAGIEHAIICPGSRNAPLTMAFARHPDINCQSVVDERSAGFIALGMAYRSGMPVALICTSGSAVVNFYPAIVEAYYQRVPLIVITADRPPEMIDQWDGQTMHQQQVFGKHIKASYTLPDRYDNFTTFSQTTAEAINLAYNGKKGPVHINVPLREPLYTAIHDTFNYPDIKPLDIGLLKPWDKPLPDLTALQAAINQYKKVLIVVGAQPEGDIGLIGAYEKFAANIPTVCDVIANQPVAYRNIHHADMLLSIPNPQLKVDLQPDVLLTFGTSMVSKNLKQFLRQYKPKHHFHISENGETADPFGTLPIQIVAQTKQVFSQLDLSQLNGNYLAVWKNLDEKIATATDNFLSQPVFHELATVNTAINHLPQNSYLQLANSMAVRWVNILGNKKHIFGSTWGNRGVSGIDGCTSTTVGVAYVDSMLKETGESNYITLLTGDVAFFYDSNALWNKFAPANLRIVVLNNGGGAIFRLIDGPGQMPEREEFLETRHNRNARLLCEDMNVEYAQASNFEELETELIKFYQPSNTPKVLEVFTDAEINTQKFKEYKELIYGLENI